MWHTVAVGSDGAAVWPNVVGSACITSSAISHARLALHGSPPSALAFLGRRSAKGARRANHLRPGMNNDEDPIDQVSQKAETLDDDEHDAERVHAVEALRPNKREPQQDPEDGDI